MQLIKHKIKLKPTVDQQVGITFSENVGLSGLQEDIDNYVAEQTGLSINDVDDAETFRYRPDDTFTMKVYFWSGSTFQSHTNKQDLLLVKQQQETKLYYEVFSCCKYMILFQHKTKHYYTQDIITVIISL